jgi:hypothetical protein
MADVSMCFVFQTLSLDILPLEALDILAQAQTKQAGSLPEHGLTNYFITDHELIIILPYNLKYYRTFHFFEHFWISSVYFFSFLFGDTGD